MMEIDPMLRRTKKQTLTLLEIMIVILLIGLIGSVIGYNMKGSLEEGKAFKTTAAIEKLHDILMLEVAKGFSIDEVISNIPIILKNSGLVKDPNKLLVDGWNQKLDIHADQWGTDIVIKSTPYENYLNRKKANLGTLAKHENTETEQN